MELEHGTLEGLGLAHGIGKQPQGIEALGLLQGLLKIQFTLLKRPHRQAGFGSFTQPTGRTGHILHPLELRFVAQHLAQVLLLLLGQLGQLPHQRGNHPRWQQVFGRALANLLRQQGAGGGGELITEAPHLFAGDLLTLIGGLADHLLHFQVRLGGFEEGALGKVVHAGFLQQAASHQAVGRLR